MAGFSTKSLTPRAIRPLVGPLPGGEGKHGLSLVEVIITLAIFVVLAGFMFLAVKEVVTQWKLSERRRTLYEKATGVVDILADDIRLAATREPTGATEVKCKFIGDYAPESRGDRKSVV